MIILLVGLLIVLYLLSFVSPKIYITTELKNVLDKDYDIFINNNDDISEDKKTRDNCRFVSLSLKIKRPPLLIRNINIERISLEDYIREYVFYNDLENELKSMGHYLYSGNIDFSEGINNYMDDLTKEKVKDIFNDYVLIVKWNDFFNKNHSQVYHMSDYIGW